MPKHPRELLADRYALESELGVGGMASVWLARDLRHNRAVAIKVIRREVAGALGGDRFLREVQLTARLQHPNIVPLLDSGTLRTEDGVSLPWYAMPYLPGESLRARLARERQLAIEDAIHIAESVAAALQAAHREGVIHRDIKPENVLLADGHVYVVDFGIAKALTDATGEQLTSTGLSVGTLAYMSPEQAAGDSVDARTDQYSLATVLYEMLAGDVPFASQTAQALVARRLAEPARPIRSVRPAVPEAVEHAVLKALERTPADRFPDIATFIAALKRPVDPGRRTVRKRTLLASLGAAIAVAGVAFALQIVGNRDGTTGIQRDPVVLALYERGIQSLSKRTEEGARDALTSFKAALDRDSSYGAAWTGLAQAYQQAVNRRFVFTGAERDSVLRLAVTAIDRAAALDGRNADVLFAQAMVARLVDPTNLTPALNALRQAAALDPGAAPIWLRLGVTLFDVGERDEAFRAWHRAIAIDPSFTEAMAFLALGFMWARQYDSAAYWSDSAIAVNPNDLLARTTNGFIEVERGNFQRASGAFAAARRLGSGVEVPNMIAHGALVAARAGQRTEALGLLAQVESLMTRYTPAPSHNAVYNAVAYAAVGDPANAVRWLERYSPSQDQHFQLHLRCDPAFDPIADVPRFRALLVTPRPPASRGC